nr:hypothetical protein B0A51_08769 [Rachicladosporium sp. CCFEE 5018]
MASISQPLPAVYCLEWRVVTQSGLGRIALCHASTAASQQRMSEKQSNEPSPVFDVPQVLVQWPAKKSTRAPQTHSNASPRPIRSGRATDLIQNAQLVGSVCETLAHPTNLDDQQDVAVRPWNSIATAHHRKFDREYTIGIK